MLLRIKFIFDDYIKRTRIFNNSSSFSYRQVTYSIKFQELSFRARTICFVHSVFESAAFKTLRNRVLNRPNIFEKCIFSSQKGSCFLSRFVDKPKKVCYNFFYINIYFILNNCILLFSAHAGAKLAGNTVYKRRKDVK